MTRPKLVQARITSLKAGVSTTEATEIILVSLLDSRLEALAMSDFGDIGYITLNPNRDNEEIVSFTGLTVDTDGTVTLSGITRDLLPQTPYTAGGDPKQHGAGDLCVVSNNPQIYESILDYIDGIAIAGAPDASSTTKGLVEMATQAEIDAGTINGSTGAKLAIGPDQLASSKYSTQLPSADEKAGIAGLSASNMPIIDIDLTNGDIDSSQTTSTNTIEVGEADATTKKNILAQKFVATKTASRGVKLWKKANTGTFTGTVTISLQADTAGSPSGTDLASITISNANWLDTNVYNNDAEFEALFTAEYTSLTVGNTYWIIVDTSTSDNSNHPNLGGRTSGGNGFVKYKNVTDGWVTIASSDLYFKALEGNISKIVESGTDGKINKSLIGTSRMLGLKVQQFVVATSGTASAIPFSTLVPANAINAGKIIKLTGYVSSYMGAAGGSTITISFGGSTVVVDTDGTDNHGGGLLECYIAGITNSTQYVYLKLATFISGQEVASAANVGFSKLMHSATGSFSIDSTVEQLLKVTIATNTGSVNHNITTQWFMAEVIG